MTKTRRAALALFILGVLTWAAALYLVTSDTNPLAGVILGGVGGLLVAASGAVVAGELA